MSLEDLALVDEERARLRRELELGADAWHADLELLEATKRESFAARLEAVMDRKAARPVTVSDFKAQALLEREGLKYRELEGRLRETLRHDAEVYAERRSRLEAEGARRRALLRVLAAAAAGGLLLAGALMLRRRRLVNPN